MKHFMEIPADNNLRVSLEVAVIIPTYNEVENVEPLLRRLDLALKGIHFEVIFVDDDSPDGTAELVRTISLRDPRVRVIQRVGRKGLASACLEGMMATAAPYVAVMDGDQQHDETILPQMLARAKAGPLDLVVGTRNALGGSMGEFSESRVLLSKLGARLSHWVARVELSDPMSGYFLLDRHWLNEVIHLTSAIGFKVLLDLVASSPRPPRIAEIPYTFRTRELGESKLDILVGLEYFQLLLDKLFGHILPVRFILFSMVGTVGLLVALALLFVCTEILGWAIDKSHIIVTIIVMIGNFFLNNTLTYRNQRLKGKAILFGLASFTLACSFGVLLNLQVRNGTSLAGLPWYIASGLGLVVGAAWNYAVSSAFVWRRNRSMLSKRTLRTTSRSAALRDVGRPV